MEKYIFSTITIYCMDFAVQVHLKQWIIVTYCTLLKLIRLARALKAK